MKLGFLTTIVGTLVFLAACPGSSPQAQSQPQTSQNQQQQQQPTPFQPPPKGTAHKPTQPAPKVSNEPGDTNNAPPPTSPLAPAGIPLPKVSEPGMATNPPSEPNQPSVKAQATKCPPLTDKVLFESVFGAIDDEIQVITNENEKWDVLSFKFQLNGGAIQNYTAQDRAFVRYMGDVAPAHGVAIQNATNLEVRPDANKNQVAVKLSAENTSKDALFATVVKPDLSKDLEACRYMTEAKHANNTIILDVVLTHEKKH